MNKHKDKEVRSSWNDNDLEALLSVEKVGPDCFLNRHADCNLNGSIFGGQLIGQTVFAALQTVEAARPMHALHATFLRPGSSRFPLEFGVERTLDGRTFTCRRVVLRQDGRTIMTAEISCHAGEAGDDHYHNLKTDVPPPDQLPSVAELIAASGSRLPPAARQRLERQRKTVDVRIVNLDGLLASESSDDTCAVWLRIACPLPDDNRWHAAAFGYLSDYWMASPFRMLPGAPQRKGDITISSLNHALWIHRPCRPDNWLLAINEIPSEQQGRRLNRAKFFDTEGRLVASSAQEQLIRVAD